METDFDVKYGEVERGKLVSSWDFCLQPTSVVTPPTPVSVRNKLVMVESSRVKKKKVYEKEW